MIKDCGGGSWRWKELSGFLIRYIREEENVFFMVLIKELKWMCFLMNCMFMFLEWRWVKIVWGCFFYGFFIYFLLSCENIYICFFFGVILLVNYL